MSELIVRNKSSGRETNLEMNIGMTYLSDKLDGRRLHRVVTWDPYIKVPNSTC
jgi:hypothetical protein